MATIVSVHSIRGGTGKSNTTANIAAVLASQGKRVGVIDGDIQSPGIHTIFGLSGSDVTTTLNDSRQTYPGASTSSPLPCSRAKSRACFARATTHAI